MLIEGRPTKEITEKIPNLSAVNLYRHRVHSGFNPTPRPIANPKWKKLSYRRAYARAWSTKAIQKDGNYNWIVLLRKKYGLTQENYWEMFKSQGGVCALCGNPPEKRRLGVDHNHITEQIRDLLCQSCNVYVGQVENCVPREILFGILPSAYLIDSPRERLKVARFEDIVRYLRKWAK